MTQQKILRSWSGYLVSAAVLCVGAAMVAGGLSSGGTTAATTVKAPLTGVPAGEYVGVCPDPAHLLEGTITGGDPKFSPKSTTAASSVSAVVLQDASSAVPPGNLSALGAKETLTTLGGSGAEDPKEAGGGPAAQHGKAAAVASHQVQQPSVLRAQPLGQQQAAAAALMTYSSDDGDLQGLAAATCQQPANDMWILGANTTLGQTALLTIANPSSTPASVDLQFHGGEGRIDTPGGRSILIPPGETESIVLGGMAPDQSRLAVRIQSSGAPVTAAIQQSALRDLTPGGVAYLTPAAGPSTGQVVTGVRIQDHKDARKIAAQKGYESTTPVLQVAVPGSTKAVAQVRAFGPQGEEPLAGDGVITVPGGTVRQIPLDDLPKGTYTIDVSADVSMVAAVRMSKGTKPSKPVDMAYAASTERMGSKHVIPVSDSADGRLVFGAPDGAAEVELTPLDSEGNQGSSTVIQLEAGTTRTIEVSEPGGKGTAGFIATASGGAVYGGQLLTADDSADIAAVKVPPAVADPRQLPVVLGY
ncbi:DUF5719 family protein [Arthrobacter castelli]|uniref:DUF5719 family protein n=1 Tax=Arthrobacter castelli TaxID=271431 RepID=UPI000418328F|nr:DUF5719 family protein [Arthrobacter castelli]